MPNIIRKYKDPLKLIITRANCMVRVGHFGANLGDIAVHIAMQELFLDYRFINVEGKLSQIDQYGGRLINLKAVILGGGTLIKYHYDEILRQVLNTYPQKKFLVLGTGVADVDLWREFGVCINVDLWKQMLEKSIYLGVRGPLSKKHLEDWGLEKEAQIVGDLAIWFARSDVRAKQKKRKIGINLGPSGGNIIGQDEQKVIEFGAALLRRLEEEDWEISLFPVTKADLPFLREAVTIANIEPPSIHERYLDVDATLAELERQDIFIGEKLHSVVLAQCVYTPSIMIEYRTKCRDYMQSIDCLDYVRPTNQLDTYEVFEMVLDLYHNLDRHQEHLFAELQRHKTSLVDTADQISNELLRDCDSIN